MFSVCGGVDIEDTARAHPGLVHRLEMDPRTELDLATASRLVHRAGLESAVQKVATTLVRMHGLYRQSDAELIEINPLAVTAGGEAVALDCKLIVDPAAAVRQPAIASAAATEPLTRT